MLVAELHRSLNQLDEADNLFRRAKHILDGDPNADPTTKCLLVNQLGLIAGSQGDETLAAIYFSEAVVAAQGLPQPNNALLAQCSTNLGESYYNLGQYGEAEKNLRYSVRLIENDPDNLHTLALTLNVLAMVLRALDNYPEAEHAYRKCINGYERLYGPEALPIAPPLCNLGGLYVLMCKFDLAEACLKQSLSIALRNGATGGEAVMLPVMSLIALHELQGRTDDAERLQGCIY